MIRSAQRPLSSVAQGSPALVLLGKNAEGKPTVSVDAQRLYAGNPAYTDPAVLRQMAEDLRAAADYLEEATRG